MDYISASITNSFSIKSSYTFIGFSVDKYLTRSDRTISAKKDEVEMTDTCISTKDYTLGSTQMKEVTISLNPLFVPNFLPKFL